MLRPLLTILFLPIGWRAHSEFCLYPNFHRYYGFVKVLDLNLAEISWFGSWYVLSCVSSLSRMISLWANLMSRSEGTSYGDGDGIGDRMMRRRIAGRVFFDIDVD